MLARPVLRATAAARVGLRPATPFQLRASSTATSAPKVGKIKQAIDNTPVDLYPLFFFVSAAVAGSFFSAYCPDNAHTVMGYTLATDPHLRLKPTSMQQRE
ncbi:hypothetical protein CC85DRAFT_298718 [Cutaneotrichosporon oleaginosum]|uniref:Uncharacterized protein n=1 Tax=Cutaneotrichosporon oleaginosum TaxID=879819 RepID=A0A0J0XZQ9_9TREE|nr:uncharacterized protein CC85DRAFT_298718 [Cutaneotrichosporon oleaginosum]KLT46532.1 hypothetical protein CC85DRAFT_298718 [Cutaneotrichosporon oleaginosum]TXT15101.1 hypothetical protein COLE_01294 [Cutaneotrichosporon oleaginosum]